LAFLNARSCDKGVEEALVQKVQEVQDLDFFRSLIYTRDLAVIIDGLNEVSAEVRATIIDFANRFSGADLLIATQPIESVGTDRSPLTKARTYELLPLGRDDIEAFLKSRPNRTAAGGRVTGEAYDAAVTQFVTERLGELPTKEERKAAELILSNPMDLTYASELIAMGQTPRPSQMIAQAFDLACEAFKRNHGRDFPIVSFARKVVELRTQDRNWLQLDEFPNERTALEDYRLLVLRPMRDNDGKEITVSRFRHDKVIDFLMKPAFDADTNLQIAYIEDPRFRGVYLLYAQDEDVETARRLRDMLVTKAAASQDHTLSDEFVRRFDLQTV